MIYEEFPAPPDLRPIVACFWRFRTEEPLLHIVPPDGTVSITWLPEQRFAVVVGPRMEALRVQVSANCDYRGLRLRPGIVESALGVAAPALHGQNIPFRFCAPHLPQLRDPLTMEDWVREWPHHKPTDPRPLAWIETLMQDPDHSIADLAAASGLSYRQMLRLFYASVGLTPKEFARLRKIREACVQSLFNANWASISAEFGYADQSHLTREFSQVFGWPPRLMQEYLRRIELAQAPNPKCSAKR